MLALLPTATDNIMGELQTERITFELQQQKAAKLAKTGDGQPSEFGSTPPSVTDDDGRSLASFHSESGMHISQLGIPTANAAGEGPQDGGQQVTRTRKSKLQLWNDLKISGKAGNKSLKTMLMFHSHHAFIYTDIHAGFADPAHPHPAQSPWAKELPL